MGDFLIDPSVLDETYRERQQRLRQLLYAGPEGGQDDDEGTPLPSSLDPSVLMANTVRHMEAERAGKAKESHPPLGFAERRAAVQQAAREKERKEQEERHRIQQIESKASAKMWQAWQTAPACVSWRNAVAQASSTLLQSARERIQRSCVALRLAAKSALVNSIPFPAQLGLSPDRICYEAESFCLHFEHGSMVGSLGAGAFDGQHRGIDTSAATTLSAWCHNRPAEPQQTQAAGQASGESYAAAPVKGDVRQRP